MKLILPLLLLTISLFASFGECHAQRKNDYWVINIETYPMYDSIPYYYYQVYQHGRFSGVIIRDIMNGFRTSEGTTYEEIKKYLIKHTLAFCKKNEPVYLINHNTGKKIRIK